MKLKLGVVDQSPVRNGGTAADAIAETLQLARITEDLGYSRYWLAEHHSTNSFAGSSPAVLIPRVASVTERIRVGSGGVMLSHYSPLQVAENFRLLETMFPGRIDLGVGRAPGGDGRTALALQYGRGGIGVDQYPAQVEHLVGWLTDGFQEPHPWRRVRAMPRAASVPELWMLGSGGSTGAYAAQLSAGYSFAQFISGQDGAPMMRRYHEHFQPDARNPAPRGNVALGVICADTAQEARRLAGSMELWGRRIMRGQDRGIPSVDDALAELEPGWAPPPLGTDGSRMIAGDPGQVRDELLRVAARYGVDEVMVVTVTHSWEARVRSYQLLADALL
ncbi:MAG TPA: LLM class flavin-dependent oxidoreductase [Longimicrobium sp.]|uniref:LLM class flavin-dependent oxidoreductase n=1 Tax=Longimicrobium sp. TaxID=2029185 RepID=UPI002EDB036E